MGADGGGATVTSTDAFALVFPAPVQLRRKALSAVSGPLFTDPLVLLLPDHAPDAEQLDALVAVQLIVVESPEVMAFGEALIATVGVSGVVTVTTVDV